MYGRITASTRSTFAQRASADRSRRLPERYVRRRGARIGDLAAFARTNRVQAVMAPYLAALL